MGTFYLKKNDFGGYIEVTLYDPAAAGVTPTAHDLSVGSPTVYLNISLSDGTALDPKVMTIQDAANGVVRYQWLETDWDAGELVVSPTPPFSPGVRDHRMEYEVVRAASPERLTFPNGGPQGAQDAYDTLHIWEDIAEGA